MGDGDGKLERDDAVAVAGTPLQLCDEVQVVWVVEPPSAPKHSVFMVQSAGDGVDASGDGVLVARQAVVGWQDRASPRPLQVWVLVDEMQLLGMLPPPPPPPPMGSGVVLARRVGSVKCKGWPVRSGRH